MIEDRIPLEPCHPGCTGACSRNRRALRALLVSIGLLAAFRIEPPSSSRSGSTARASRG
jgi:hypothetical protein